MSNLTSGLASMQALPYKKKESDNEYKNNNNIHRRDYDRYLGGLVHIANDRPPHARNDRTDHDHNTGMHHRRRLRSLRRRLFGILNTTGRAYNAAERNTKDKTMIIWVSRNARRPIARLENPSPDKLRELRRAGYSLIAGTEDTKCL